MGVLWDGRFCDRVRGSTSEGIVGLGHRWSVEGIMILILLLFIVLDITLNISIVTLL